MMTCGAPARAAAVVVPAPPWWTTHYWAQRVHFLGIGIAHAPGTPTTDSLTGALDRVLQPGVAVRTKSIATAVRSDGAQAGAQRLIDGD